MRGFLPFIGSFSLSLVTGLQRLARLGQALAIRRYWGDEILECLLEQHPDGSRTLYDWGQVIEGVPHYSRRVEFQRNEVLFELSPFKWVFNHEIKTYDLDNNLVHQVVKTYENFYSPGTTGPLPKLMRVDEGVGDRTYVTEIGYYTDREDDANYRHVKYRKFPDGRWEVYRYGDDNGSFGSDNHRRLVKTIRPWGDMEFSEDPDELLADVETISYASSLHWSASTVIRTIAGKEIGRRGSSSDTVFWPGMEGHPGHSNSSSGVSRDGSLSFNYFAISENTPLSAFSNYGAFMPRRSRMFEKRHDGTGYINYSFVKIGVGLLHQIDLAVDHENPLAQYLPPMPNYWHPVHSSGKLLPGWSTVRTLNFRPSDWRSHQETVGIFLGVDPNSPPDVDPITVAPIGFNRTDYDPARRVVARYSEKGQLYSATYDGPYLATDTDELGVTRT